MQPRRHRARIDRRGVDPRRIRGRRHQTQNRTVERHAHRSHRLLRKHQRPDGIVRAGSANVVGVGVLVDTVVQIIPVIRNAGARAGRGPPSLEVDVDRRGNGHEGPGARRIGDSIDKGVVIDDSDTDVALELGLIPGLDGGAVDRGVGG